MKLIDKRFWIWIAMIALMPVMMGVFTGCVLVETFAELFYYPNIELFLLWEIAYLVGGLLSYHKLQSFNWLKCALLFWGIVCPLLLCSSFKWAGIRIHDGFSGLAYFMISGILWGFSILPLMVCTWLYKNKFAKI
ncbi:MAG: hypothetical protein HDP28_00840 [Clostridia bacterium]|nr:hypothetical protein [Clostridia bacterium]